MKPVALGHDRAADKDGEEDKVELRLGQQPAPAGGKETGAKPDISPVSAEQM